MVMRQTSVEAYNELDLGKRQREVYKAIEKLQYATNTMISKYLKLPINCITGRTRELFKKNLIKKSHTSWDPITKHKAIYWTLTK